MTMDGCEPGRLRRETTWRIVRRMSRRFRPLVRPVAGSLALVLVSVCLGVSNPLLLRLVIDALPDRDAGVLLLLCGTMVAVGLLSSAVTVGNAALTSWIGQRLVAELRVDVYDKARSQRLDFYTGHGTSEIQARLVSDIGGVGRFFTTTAQTLLAAVTVLLAAVAAMVILSWPLALLSVVLAVALGRLNNRLARRRRRLAERRQGLITALLHHVEEHLSWSGVLLARTVSATDRQRAAFVDLSEQVRDTTFRQRVVGAVTMTVISAAFACIPPVIYLLGGTVVTGLSVGTVVVLVILQIRLADPIQTLLRTSATIQESIAMFERIVEYLDLPTEDAPTPSTRVSRAPDTVRLRDVSFTYAGACRPAVEGVDLDLPGGSVTVIVGPTGSGKSTLGLLLGGLLVPDRGTVGIDGADTADPRALRDVATLVPQHTTLFDGSIRDNLAVVRTGIADHEIARALAAVRLDARIAETGLGHDTPVGQHGHRLSGGERQRLAIARALLTPCGLLVLDEATSALDGVTARRIHRTLRARCRATTLIIIAHQVPPLEPGDQVVVMEHGRVAEQGNHAELVARGGAYGALLAETPPAAGGHRL